MKPTLSNKDVTGYWVEKNPSKLTRVEQKPVGKDRKKHEMLVQHLDQVKDFQDGWSRVMAQDMKVSAAEVLQFDPSKRKNPVIPKDPSIPASTELYPPETDELVWEAVDLVKSLLEDIYNGAQQIGNEELTQQAYEAMSAFQGAAWKP